jgi:hypothetical protein
MPLASAEHKGKWYNSDDAFDKLLPFAVRVLSHQHWTPLHVAHKAIQFLAPADGTKVLDIGSGAGKFCIAGGYYKPQCWFTGVEQRKSLIVTGEMIADKLSLENVSFLNGNFTRIDFTKYDSFYFYNSFYENLNGTDKIDSSIEYSSGLYYYYCRCLSKKLDEMPVGTRLATFHSLENEIPLSYRLTETWFDNSLKLWARQ